MAAKKERPAPPRKTPGKAAANTARPAANPALAPEELRKLIAEAAYFRAKNRGFAPGYEVEDWIQAEAEVKRLIGRTA